MKDGKPMSQQHIDPASLEIPSGTQVFKFQAQPGVRIFANTAQEDLTIAKANGEVENFGPRIAERVFGRAKLYLSCDAKNGLWWVIIFDAETEMVYKTSYFLADQEAVMALVIQAPEAELRAELMSVQEPGTSN